jgi:LPS O-antigen subunit length determinant protein (WzzB/FepE family)
MEISNPRGTLLCALTAGVISFQMSKIYSISMVLRPGILQVRKDGNNIYIDSPQNIKAMIDAGTFNNQIINDIINPEDNDSPKSLKIKVKIPKESDAIVASYETSDIKLGLRILKNLSNLLLGKYSEMINYHRKQHETSIIMKKAEIENYNVTIKSYEQHIKNLDRRIHELASEIKIVNENTNSLISERDKFLSDNVNPDNILSSILYTNTIQQNITLANTYKNQIKGYNSEKENYKISLEKAKGDFQKLLESIKSLEFEKNSIQNIQILQPPSSSPYPIGPKKKLNVILAAVVGLFALLFLAFFLEYISKYKRGESK